MGGRHEVDVLAAHLLHAQHDLGELVGRDLIPGVRLRDVRVLAVHAAQVAASEEDRAAAAAAHKGALLAPVRTEGGDAGSSPGAAEGARLARPVGAALVRAHDAADEPGERLVGAAAQLAGGVQVGVAHGHRIAQSRLAPRDEPPRRNVLSRQDPGLPGGASSPESLSLTLQSCSCACTSSTKGDVIALPSWISLPLSASRPGAIASSTSPFAARSGVRAAKAWTAPSALIQDRSLPGEAGPGHTRVIGEHSDTAGTHAACDRVHEHEVGSLRPAEGPRRD